MLHERAGTRTDAAGHIDLAAGGAVGRGVAAIPLDDQSGAGIKPAGIGGGRAFHDDLGAVEAEGADALTGVFHLEPQGRAVRSPQRTADIVMPGGEDFKFRLALFQGGIDLLQQFLGGNALFFFVETDDLSRHC